MNRGKPLPFVGMVVLVAACGPAIGMPEGTSADALAYVVEDMMDYDSPRSVPQRWRHLVDCSAGTGPVVLLFGSGMACAITTRQAHDAHRGQPYRCRWSGPR